MGPLKLTDLVGLDVRLAILERSNGRKRLALSFARRLSWGRWFALALKDSEKKAIASTDESTVSPSPISAFKTIDVLS